MSYTPGFGDEVTWGPYTGHPNDPRAPEDAEDPPAVGEEKPRTQDSARVSRWRNRLRPTVFPECEGLGLHVAD